MTEAGWSELAQSGTSQDFAKAVNYSECKSEEPEHLQQTLFAGVREGGLALLRDLHDLYLLACEVELCWRVLLQAPPRPARPGTRSALYCIPTALY